MGIVNKHENTILYVDDEPANLRVFQTAFRWDYNVITESNPTKVLGILNTEKVHVVVSDQKMPEMTGLQLLEQVRDVFPKTMRVLFTAYADLSILQEAINNGIIHYYCPKPLNVDELNGIIQKCLEYYVLKEENELLINDLKDANEQLKHHQNQLEDSNSQLEERVKERTHQLEITNNALQASTAFSQLIINSYSAHIAVLDEKGEVIFTNNNWHKLNKICNGTFPFCQESHNYFSIPELINPDEHSEFGMLKRQIELVLSDKIKSHEQYYEHTIDNKHTWFLMKVSRLVDGNMNNAILAIENVTVQKNAEANLISAKLLAEEANKAKSAFVANISHDLRTPLNSVLGFSDLLLKTEVNSEQFNYLSSIKSSGTALLELINDIIDISKIDAGKVELELVESHLASFIDDVLNIFKERIISKNIELLVEIDDNVPSSLLLDQVRLRQILMNLIGNAIKFTENGHVLIRIFTTKSFTKEDDNYVNLGIEVEDSGIGIGPAFKEQIFEAFTQEKNKLMSHTAGTGLGLFIVKNLTDLMSGEISVDSELGRGTTFKLLFNDIKVGTNNLETVGKQYETVQFSNTKIVIADDNDYNRIYLKEILNNAGMDVILASNGQELLNQVKEHHPDIIFTEIEMPTLDGYSATVSIKKIKELRNIPVVAVTSSALNKQDDQIYYDLFDELLIKPVNSQQIESVLKKLLPNKIKQAVKNEHDCTSLQNLENELDEQLIEKLSPHLHALNGSYLKLKNQQPIAEVEKFGRQLFKLGQDHGVKSIAQYGSSILESVNTFEIDKMLNLLNQFPDLLYRMDKIKV